MFANIIYFIQEFAMSGYILTVARGAPEMIFK